ncbi:MAG: hypothetical protein AAF483_12485 [Planctomycetota bacterium]
MRNARLQRKALSIAGLCCAFFMIAASTLLAQPPNQRRGGPNNRTREMMQKVPERELLDMLRHASVREELEVSDETMTELYSLRDSAMREVMSAMQLSSDDERLEKLLDIFQKQSKKAMELLAENGREDTIDRLEGIWAQHRGPESIGNSRIAKRVRLSDDELKAFRERIDEEQRMQWRQSESIMQSLRSNKQLTTEQREKLDKIRAKRDANLLRSLSEKQREAFEKLKGDPFDGLPKHGRFHGHPRGRPGGPGGSGRPSSRGPDGHEHKRPEGEKNFEGKGPPDSNRPPKKQACHSMGWYLF